MNHAQDPETAPRVLVLGGSGFVGRALLRSLGGRAIGTYAANPFPGGVFFDAASRVPSEVLPKLERFSHAVLLFGQASPDRCFQDPRGSRRLNVDRTKAVVDDLARAGVAVVFTSTESVFDGRKGGYTESDPARPVLEYGRQKLEVEEFLLNGFADAAVLRLGRVFGSDRGDRTLFTSWLALIERDADIACARDNRFSPIHASETARGIALVVEKRLAGLYHLCGPEPMDRCSMLAELVRAYNLRREYSGRIIERKMSDFPTPEPRPLDISMRPDKLARHSGFKPAGIRQWCERICKEWYEDEN